MSLAKICIFMPIFLNSNPFVYIFGIFNELQNLDAWYSICVFIFSRNGNSDFYKIKFMVSVIFSLVFLISDFQKDWQYYSIYGEYE